MKNNMKPYKETINNNIIRRSFSKDVNENELSWHRDKKDRVVIVLENNDWMIQFDNELPKKLNVNEEIFIPKNTFHRVIKGSGDLMVEVIETDFEDGEYAIFEIIQEGKKKKKKTKRDACYYKVKSRYSVWPSAYGSGALVKCRKVGAANWGNKTDENIDDQINEKWSEKYKKSIDCSNPKGFSQKAHCQGRKKIKESLDTIKLRQKKFIKKIMEENMNIINEISSEEAYNKFYKNLFNKDDEKSDKEKFNKIIDLDPTYNKDKNKLGEYTRWLFRKDNVELLKKAKDEDLYKIKNDLEFFNTSKIKNLLPTDKKDINKFNIKTLLDFIFDLESKSDSEELKSKTDIEKEIKKDVDKYNLTNWTIIVPKTEEASCYYGKGTKWCTAATGYNNMFDRYNNRGSLYILINKQDPSEKYQFHFEDSQFMDAKDYPIRLGEFMNENDDVYEFFNKIYGNDLDFNICEASLENGDTETFENFYSNKFTDEQKESLVRAAFEGDGNSDGYYTVSMALNYIDYPDMAKDFRRDFLYGLEASLENRYDDENYDAIMFIHHIGGFNEDNIDDIMKQVDIKDLDEIEKIIQIAKHFEAINLLEIYFANNDVDFNLDMLETINSLKDKFEDKSESYRNDVLSSKLVKFEMKKFNFETGYVNGYLTPKNDNGELIKDKRSNVNIYYKNIIKYLTMPRLFTEGKKTINKTKEIDREKLSREMIKKAHDSITRKKGKEYAPDVHELQAWIDDYIKTNKIKVDESKKTNFSKEKSQGLHGWFSRKGGEGSQGWVDCNTCRKNKETGRLKCKPCGREEGEKRAKYPACRPYPSACKTKGKGKSWGKKSIKENMENFKQKLEEIMSNKDEMSNNYMFWQNLKTIYNAVSEMKGMDFENVDNVLSDGHGWALDHIATSKDDIEEVYHFLKNKIDMHGFDKHYIQRQLNETFGDDDDDERPKQTNDKDSKDKKSKKHNIEKPLNIKRENKPFLPMADIE
jgi:hypothetical protein